LSHAVRGLQQATLLLLMLLPMLARAARDDLL